MKTINADMLAKMFLAGAQNIEAKKEYINELNVFPVPDGDTGKSPGTSGDEGALQGDFQWIPPRRQRKFRRDSFPASERIYKVDSGRDGD